MSAQPAAANEVRAQPVDPFGTGSGVTGRYIVTFAETDSDAAVRTVLKFGGAKMAVSTARDDLAAANVPDSGVYFDRLGIAVVNVDPGAAGSLMASSAADAGILSVEPEPIVYAIGAGGSVSEELAAYLRGYRDGVRDAIAKVLGDDEGIASTQAAAWDEARETWGLQATRVLQSRFTGRGIRVAVLDTGIDFTHPDFLSRAIIHRSFIEGEEVQDGNGHGTHCAGTACGPRAAAVPPRFGIACDAELYVGKVLANSGFGAAGSVLDGINWAVGEGCHIVSLSLASQIRPGNGPLAFYEAAGQRALAAGTLLIAAAGNDSRRPGLVQPVSAPANSVSIMSVAALAQDMAVAHFSNGGVNAGGGGIDIAAPGVDVHSSWPLPTRYRSISGTSMATPHVAGIAALHAEADPSLRGMALWSKLTASARRLSGSAQDIGSGLAIAP
ncbi:hypothetical protein STHU_11850 [Allostella humosa]|nr:hypothetical protein STHU_11850 [Stella humosa]